jgi:hypothetical protein
MRFRLEQKVWRTTVAAAADAGGLAGIKTPEAGALLKMFDPEIYKSIPKFTKVSLLKVFQTRGFLKMFHPVFYKNTSVSDCDPNQR